MVGEFALAAQHELVVNEDYAFHLDEYRRGQDTFLLLHLRFFKWTPSVFKRYLAHFRAFRMCVSAPLFALGEVDDDKLERFVTHLGFTFHQQVRCANGESRRLFIHTAPEAPNVLLRQQKDRDDLGNEQLHDRSVGPAGRRAH